MEALYTKIASSAIVTFAVANRLISWLCVNWYLKLHEEYKVIHSRVDMNPYEQHLPVLTLMSPDYLTEAAARHGVNRLA